MKRVFQQPARLRKFWQRHIQQVKTGGWPVFTRKVRSLIKMLARRLRSLIGVIAAAPLVLLIVIIRPIVLLRFGTIISQRIGHFAVDVEAYLHNRDRDKPSRLTIDIIGCPEPVCNLQLQKMWARTMTIMPGAMLWSILDRACQLWTKGDKHHVKLYDRASEYRHLLSTQPHLSFTEEEELCGRQLLGRLGIPAGVPWICIHNRDSAYLDKALGGRWAYHDYRDFSVQTMVVAAEELTKRGYYVLRMGSVVAESLILDNPKIIDYPNHPARSDFADIYLLGNCTFHVGSDSGVWAVPAIFRKPFAFVNFPVLQTIFSSFYWNPTPFILKRAWHKDTQRFLSLREMFEAGLSGASESHLFEGAGVELICNTPDEIRDLAIEVDDRLKGHWQPQPDDEALQQRFWDICRQYAPSDHVGDIQARIGADFLRKHSELLN